MKGILSPHIQELRGVFNNKSVLNPDVYITCAGTVSRL